VTQELYHVVTGGNKSEFQGLRNSVDRVTWTEANTFCEKATKLLREHKLIKANERIRLPRKRNGNTAAAPARRRRGPSATT